MTSTSLNSIAECLEDLKAGKMIIVVDDENRENEGDFIMAAQDATPQAINFMISKGKGLVCAPMTMAIAQELDLPLMTKKQKDAHSTAFTISVDAKDHITTGISASDRALTLNLLANPQSKSHDFVSPGHIFPLIAREGGVFERPGHTEASIDLLKLCDKNPVGVICEILLEDGSCARLDDLFKMAREWDMKIMSIESLIEYLENQS